MTFLSILSVVSPFVLYMQALECGFSSLRNCLSYAGPGISKQFLLALPK